MEKIITVFCLLSSTVLSAYVNRPQSSVENFDFSILDQIFDKNYNEAPPNLTDFEQNTITTTPPSPYTTKKKIFDWVVFKAIVNQSKTPNVLISPLGIKTMFTILFEISDDGTPTKRQLEQVNPNFQGNWFLNGPELREPYEKKLNSLQKNLYTYNVDFATRIFVAEKVKPKPRITELILKYYKGLFEQVHFNEPTQAARHINDWGSHITRDNVNSFVDADSLSPSSLVILFNAVHFQALWAHKFSDETITGKFYTPDGLTDATYLRSTGRFYFLDSEELAAKIVRLPYAGQKFSMFAVLPNQKKNGLARLIEDLININFNEILRTMDATTTSVLLPKFKLDFKMSMVDVARSLQIDRVFMENGSLSGLAVPSDLDNFPEGASISNILHAASFAVDEKSVQNSVSTIEAESFGEKTAKFEAAWPFLFFIQDETTGAILFAGTVTKPEY